MHARLCALTVANIKSYTRDRAALFWTLAFPLIFIFMFGFIFQGGGGGAACSPAWVDEDGSSAAATALRAAFAAQEGTELELSRSGGRLGGDARGRGRRGHRRAGRLRRGASRRARPRTGGPTSVIVYTDPSQPEPTVAPVFQSVGAVLGVVNLGGRPPLVVPQAETIQTENLNFISYFVPSMLGLSVMQVGIFAAIPLVADREKLILKRLAATPLQALAAGRQQRPHAAAHRPRPGGHHRRRRRRLLRCRDHRPVGR